MVTFPSVWVSWSSAWSVRWWLPWERAEGRFSLGIVIVWRRSTSTSPPGSQGALKETAEPGGFADVNGALPCRHWDIGKDPCALVRIRLPATPAGDGADAGGSTGGPPSP
jgi:hypothetical protein